MSTGLVSVVLAAAAMQASAVAQTAPPIGHWEPVRHNSGKHDNPTPVEGVVWRDFVAAPAASPWIRLEFHRWQLGRGSYLRIVSLTDGDVQTMHSHHVDQWQSTSAYFNGTTVLLELVAGPRTSGNFVELDRVMAGDPPGDNAEDSICGTQDNRTPSSHAAVGRIFSIGCTGWIINNAAGGSTTDKLHLSAGHCFATSQVLQFAVPASGSNCALVHPPAAKQFAIDSASSQYVNGGVGNDYWVFKCFANSTTGRTSWQEQAAAMTLAASIPASGTTLRNYGFGVDGTNTDAATGNSCTCSSSGGTGSRNQTQQTHTGSLASVSGNRLNHTIDTCGGNSGSVLTNNSSGQAVGIHTHGGCTSTGGSNSGTGVLHSGLVAAIAAMSSGSSLANDNCSGALTVVVGNNGTYSTTAATTSTPTWACGTGGKDIWFRYVVNCAATVTFHTCSTSTNFDTVLQVFSGSCTALTSLGCNDDWSGCSSSTLRSRVAVTTTGATTLYVRVGGYNGASGSFVLNVANSACP
ncbi:MAG: hypothetical protein WBO45_07060 [Planctomycetota bacterium]